MNLRTAAPPPRQQPRRPRLIPRFRCDERGATAIEFSLVALPFLLILAATIEMAMMFWTSQILEESLSRTARTLLTGQSKDKYKGTSAANMEAFKKDVCANAAFPMIVCDKLFVDVRSYASFGSAGTGTAASSPIKGGGLDASGFSYSQPQAGEIVVVRAALEYPLFFTQWSQAAANIGTGRTGLVATTAFKAEPFS